MRSEPEGIGAASKFFAAQMPDIVLATRRHLRRSGVAYVGIVCPHDGLGLRPVKVEQCLQRFKHVSVAQIPGGAASVVHDPVVTLGVRHQAGILHRIHKALAVMLGVVALFVENIL
jgi:hypothetical protein